MRHETIEGKTHIYLEAGEKKQEALRAIARASYSSAQAVGMGMMHFRPGSTLTDEECDSLMNIDGNILRMDYVHGRQCKTYLTEVSETEFTLLNSLYERDRGAPDAMLNEAAAIFAEDQDETTN